MDKNLKKTLASLIILVVSLGAVALFSKYTPYLENLELKNYDFMLAILRGPLEPPSDLAIVAIDDLSLDAIGPWPWPRSIHGELLDALSREGARAVVFDVAFIGETVPSEDEELASAIHWSKAPVVIAAALEVVDDPRFSMVRQLLPLEQFREAGASLGFATLNPDRDGLLRHGRLFVSGATTLVTEVLDRLDLAPDYSSIPIASFEGEDPEILINYVGGGRSIPTVSYDQALDAANSLPEGFFRDRIVLVGTSLAVTTLRAGAETDHYPSPFDGFSGVGTMPGVEIHASILNTILRQQFIRRSDMTTLWFMMVALGLVISTVILSNESFAVRILASLVLMAGWVVCAVSAFLYAQTWLYLVQPLVVMLSVFALNVLYQYRQTERERAHIRRALSGYVSKQVMSEILKNPGQLELGGVQVEASVLFSDIAGFSKISERITPKELATLLNDYFTRVGDIIMDRDGMINKYIGDAVMAIWNAPLPNPDHARLACQAALQMRRAVAQMPPLRMRVGINTGPMVAGNLGHRERMEYTVIGDAVNLASRLEGANKAFGTVILISETTETMVRDSFLTRRVDNIRVVGKERPVAVFEVLAELNDPEAEGGLHGELALLVESFQGIAEAYDDRNWKRAVDLTEAHLDRFTGDLVASVYLKRCRQFLIEPPADDWDGVVSLESK